jgi:ferredoxin
MENAIYSFIGGPLLWIVFLIFTIGIITRVVLFFYEIIKSSKDKGFSWRYSLGIFMRSFLPLHYTVSKRPIYTTLIYIFHVCLIVVPIWLRRHINLWEESRFGWRWTALPSVWADYMTLLLLSLVVYFLLRRIILTQIRRTYSTSDYILIVITALPFLTGYFLAHGNLDSLSFLRNNLFIIHVLSGEAMLLLSVFLFYRTLLDIEKCTACGACELRCPTGTLEYKDEGKLRIFTYSHYQCICCGTCINNCPEGAAELQHEISLGRFFQIGTKRELWAVKLKICEKCGSLLAPKLQLERIESIITHDHMFICSKCKRANCAEILNHLAPVV